MIKRETNKNRSRTSGFSGLLCLGFALALSAASVTVTAQTAFEFEDPLDQIRSEMERKAAETESPTSVADPSNYDPSDGWSASTEPTAGENAAGATDGIRARAAAAAESAGLPVAGLLGLLLAGLLALCLGLYWIFSRRGETGTPNRRKDRDLYAVSNGSRSRRTLESGAKVTRTRTGGIDTDEAASAAKMGVAERAAKILNNEPLPDEDEEFVQAYVGPDHAPVDAEDDTPVDAKNPETWKRPNLDRLKASIKEDWKPEEEASPAQLPMRTEAEAFAELFGDDDSPRAETPRTKPSVLDLLDTFEQAPENTTFSSLRSEIGADMQRPDTETAVETQRSAPPPLPSRADALRRIRALRESVKAS